MPIKTRTATRTLLLIAALLLASLTSGFRPATSPERAPYPAYLGFDRNEYPRDSNLNALRQTFSYSGYWLNSPPGARANSWKGKRQALQDAGFGFLVLFNGRTYAEIKHAGNATKLGTSDAAAAIAAARAEGFPPHTVIFLDQEQGGLVPESWALTMLQRSRLMSALRRVFFAFIRWTSHRAPRPQLLRRRQRARP